MQKDTLLALLHKPESLLEDHLEELEEIIQKYPYFHLPHTLVAKLLHTQQSSLAPQKIRKASLYVYNRAVLKEFILNNPEKIDVKEEFSQQDQPHRNPLVDIQQEMDDFDKKLESSSIEDLEKELASITESYLPKDYLAEETKSQENNDTPAEQTENQKEQNSLIDDFLNNFASKSSESTSSPTPLYSSIVPDEQTEEEAIRLFDEGNTQAAIAIYEQLKLKFPEKAAYYQSQIDIFSMDFSSLNTQNTELSEDIGTPSENPSQENFDTNSLITDLLHIQPNDEKSTEKLTTQEESLPLQEENVSSSSEDKTTESTLSFTSEVTEAQAIDYFNNGDVAKAIEIYRQLILQNPEKKAYFASQIEILES
ncbi:MAG: hypothetical protein OHK0045_07890 [Raineya sp.]